MVHGRPTAAASPALSAAQHRLWLAARVEPDSFEFTVPWAARVHGALDTGALASAWTAVVRRHAELRLRVTEHAGEPGRAQWPVERLAARVRVIDRADVDEELRRAASRVFDLAGEPLAELEILQVGPLEHLVLLTAHHIVTDGRSVHLVTTDLFRAYEGETDLGSAPDYVDYAAWEATSSRPAEDKVAARIEELRVPVADRPLGLGEPRPVEGKRGAVVRVPLDAGLWAAVRSAASDLRTTPQVVGMAALALTLRRYTDTRDIVLGGTMDTRTGAYADTVGMFINPTPVRLRVEDDQTAADYLGSAHRALLRAFVFRHLPFEELVRGLGSAPASGRSPVFQVLFNYVGGPSRLTAAGLDITEVDFPVEVSKYDMTMWLRGLGDTAELAAVYRAGQYTEAQIEQFTTHLRAVLTSLSTDPASRLDDIAMLAPAEVERLVELGDGGDVTGADTLVPDLITSVAATHPDRAAVVHAGEIVDYRELDGWSAVIAQRLRARGIGAGSLVGVLTDRSPAMVAAALGVLRAGAAYVPLDPAHPDERIAATLADAAASCVLVTEATAAAGTGLPTVRADKERGAPTEPLDLPAPGRSDAAYVIYTSGTTGEPKGVVVEHAQLAASTAARRAVYPGAPVFLHVSPLAFDSSMAGLWGTLTAGGTVVVADGDDVRDPGRLLALVRRHQVTDLLCVPTLWALVLSRAGDGAALRSLRRAIVAGEALPAALPREHFAVVPDAALVNEYGPTETTVWASYRRYTEPGPVDIGGPVPGTRLSVVDSRGALSPRGAIGELRIGGAGVSRGYLGRDADTARAFVTDRRTGERVYRTGDRVRWSDAGTLEFLGRADQQVKIRGHRVELGAVETALGALDGVRAAAVLPDAARARLIGFVVADPAFDTAAALRRLAERFPDPMAPRTLHVLAEFPCTPNGKVDRAALAGLIDATPAPATAAVTDDASQVAAAWSKILGRTDLPVDANFFDVGGHSLLVPALQVALENETGTAVSIVDLFTATTVTAQTELVRAAVAPAAAPEETDDRRARMAARSRRSAGVAEVAR
jgi:amino acid adenylation domain-containing protein